MGVSQSYPCNKIHQINILKYLQASAHCVSKPTTTSVFTDVHVSSLPDAHLPKSTHCIRKAQVSSLIKAVREAE
jgi:hypothetical protein